MRVYNLFAVFSFLLVFSIPVSAGFDWGSGSGNCENGGDTGGSGSFKQEILLNDITTVGEIPVGVAGVDINLESPVDIDIQLYDKKTGEALVQWPSGRMSGRSYQTIVYDGIRIEWSGYNGDGKNPGNEYIRIFNEKNYYEPIHRTFIMKVYGFRAGVAEVNYSWESVSSQEKCENSGGNASSGSGSFQQQILSNAEVEVGVIPVGIRSLKIYLSSIADVDVRLYDAATGEAIIRWPNGLINQGGYYGERDLITDYKGMRIRYSGYNGDGTGKGNEHIIIDGETTRELVMEAFGFRAGYATIDYSWGGK